MSSIRERLLGATNDSPTSNTSIRDRLELNSSYYKNEYKNEISKRNAIQNDIQKSTYEKGVQTTVTPFSTQRNILPVQEQSEITKSKKFEITAGQDKLKQNKDVEKKYQDIQQTDEYKKQMKELEEQSNKVGYAKYEYDKQRVAEDNIGWYDKSIGRLVDGFGNLFDYNGGLVKKENGDLMYLPTFNQMKNEKVRNEYDTAIGRFAGDVLYESGKIAGSTLINQVLPGVGSTAYFGKMFVDSTNQAITDGYDSSSATIYGLVNVGLEYGVGKLLGSATKGLTGGKTNDYEKLLKKTFTNITKKPKIANILANAGSEATEEFVQEYLDNISKLLILDKSTNIKDYTSIFLDENVLSDALYSAAIGSVTGGVIGTISGKDTNVDNNDVNLYDTFKKELEETKENTTNKDTINKIDTIISSIDSNINNDSNVNTIISQINEYEALKEQNKITKEQEIELNNLKEQLNAIQNQNTDTSTSSKAEVNLPTVKDIVNQEKSSQNSVNLPVYNQQSNITNSDKAILPTVNDFNSSNINMPNSNIKVDIAKIKPEILEDIKGFKLGDASIESYKGSYIKTMLNEVGIKVSNAMNYVSEVRPDMSFTTTKDLTRQQYSSISNALQKLRSIDVTSVNNINNAIAPGDISQIKQIKGNIPINQNLLNDLNSNLNFYSDKEYSNIKSDKIEIAKSDADIMDFVDEAINSKSSNKTIYFGKINDSLAQEIYNSTGIDVKGYNLSLKANNIKKILKDHGDVKTEELRGQVAVTKNDFRYIDDIVLENDTFFSSGTTPAGKPSITFEKVINEKYMLVEYVSDKHHTLEVQTMWKNKKKNSVTVLRDNNPGLNTPKAGSDTSSFSANNIPQSNENVKSSILPITNNMQNNKNNTSNLMPTKEYFEDKKNNEDLSLKEQTKERTNENSEKLAEILKEKPTMENNKDGWLKKLATIKFIDKGYYVDKLARKTKNKELSSKYDYSLSANGIANQIIGNGRFDNKGNKIGKGLYEIFEPIENSGLLDEFSNYIYHKHNVDRMSLQNRFNEANKAIFGDGMTSEMSEKKVSEYETKYPEFEAWANDIYEYNNANLEMLVKYGVLSKENVKYYNKKYPHYVPTIRENSKTKTQMDFLLGKKASVNSPIKKAKGGNGDIIPLKDAMALRTMQTVNSSLRNNFGLELLNTVETEQIRNKENVDNIIEDVNMEELLTKSDNSNSATLTVFENGEKITFDISDEIYEALKPSNIYTIKWLNKFNNIRRGLLTEYNPTFMITNPLKDIQDGSINSKHPETFAKNLIEAGKQIKNKGQYYQLYIANGGSYETYFNYNTGTNIAPSKIDKIAPLKKISEINEEIEMTPRLAEFISSIEAGDSIETSMYNSNEITTNFKRGGDITKTLDRNGITFLNAGVQGTVKQIRNVQEARVEGTRGITKLAVRWTIAGLLPTLLMNMVWGDDDDYEELSDYVKNNYYIIGKYDNGEFIRIPKGRVVSVLQSFFQNVLNGANGKEIDLKGFADLIENNLLPSDPNESSLIAPIKQAINNETWYGGDLVPTRLQNLPNAEQYDETTDSISIWLGKQLNISPYKINYVLDQYSGAIGDYILPYLTQEAESGNDSFTGKLIAPVKDKFTVDSTLKNQNISDFYSLSEKLTKKSNSSNATDEDILKNKYINSIKSEISKLYAEKREIQSSSSLKDSDKYNQSKELQKQINELSKTALNNYKNIEITDNYAIVGNKEYYKNSNDEWTKIDTESPKYKIANLITKYNNYLKYNDEIKNIKNQYDNSNTRKNAVIKYVNSLDLTIPQKAMLIKMNYSSYNNYNNQIISYVNNQKISLDEKKEILEELGFKVRNGKVYTK